MNTVNVIGRDCQVCLDNLIPEETLQGNPSVPFVGTAPENRQGLLLPCGHVVCLDCLERWEAINPQISQCFTRCTTLVNRDWIPETPARRDLRTVRRIFSAIKLAACGTLGALYMGVQWFASRSASQWVNALVSTGIGDVSTANTFIDPGFSTAVGTALFDTYPSNIVGLLPVATFALGIYEDRYFARLGEQSTPLNLGTSLVSSCLLAAVSLFAVDRDVTNAMTTFAQSASNMTVMSVFYDSVPSGLFLDGGYTLVEQSVLDFSEVKIAVCAAICLASICATTFRFVLPNVPVSPTGIAFGVAAAVGGIFAALKVVWISLPSMAVWFVYDVIGGSLTNLEPRAVRVLQATRSFFERVGTHLNRRVAMVTASIFVAFAGFYAQGHFFGEQA